MSAKPTILLLLWQQYTENASKALAARCRRIHINEYGVDDSTVDSGLFGVFRGTLGPQPWKLKNIAFLRLFARGLSHKEGVDFGTALRNIKQANGKEEGRNRRVHALINQSDRDGFLQALNRLIPLDRDSHMEVDLDKLSRDLDGLDGLNDFDRDGIKLKWLASFYNPPSNPPTPSDKA